jgi:hypothetical protein
MKLRDPQKEAWDRWREPRWQSMGNGVSFYCAPPTAEILLAGAAEAQRVIGGLQEGRADLERYGFTAPEMGVLQNLSVLAGLSVLVSAVTVAELIVLDWKGVCTDEGEAVPFDAELLVDAFRLGTPDGGPALVQPFMAWLDRPRIAIGADVRRLRELTKWEHSGGAKHCEGCAIEDAACSRGGTDDGARCPTLANQPQTVAGRAALAATRHEGVWRRAGIGGELAGLDFVQCLVLAEAQGCDDAAALVRCLGAIEAGALEAAAEKRPNA